MKQESFSNKEPMNIEDRLKEIKQSFRLMMNGPASQSMREKGVNYGLNWGVPLPRLREQAKELGKDYDLAIALWKENVRECKILATLVMPAEKMPEEVAEIWIEQTPTQELAEMQAFNLYQYTSFGPKMAFRWIATDDELKQICGYGILARLFMKGQEPNERAINEFLDQVVPALKSSSVGLQHAALNALNRFTEMGVVYDRLARSLMRKENLDVL
jgi:hypothetical protein